MMTHTHVQTGHLKLESTFNIQLSPIKKYNRTHFVTNLDMLTGVHQTYRHAETPTHTSAYDRLKPQHTQARMSV